MDESLVTINKNVILIRVGKDGANSFYALVKDVLPDPKKRGWWVVIFNPLVPTKDWKLPELSWILSDSQIRGEEFTMSGNEVQLCKIQFPKPIQPDTLSIQDDADSPVPLPTKSKVPFLRRVK